MKKQLSYWLWEIIEVKRNYDTKHQNYFGRSSSSFSFTHIWKGIGSPYIRSRKFQCGCFRLQPKLHDWGLWHFVYPSLLLMSYIELILSMKLLTPYWDSKQVQRIPLSWTMTFQRQMVSLVQQERRKMDDVHDGNSNVFWTGQRCEDTLRTVNGHNRR